MGFLGTEGGDEFFLFWRAVSRNLYASVRGLIRSERRRREDDKTYLPRLMLLVNRRRRLGTGILCGNGLGTLMPFCISALFIGIQRDRKLI